MKFPSPVLDIHTPVWGGRFQSLFDKLDTTNLVAALTLTDSKRGTVVESEGTYVNPCIRAQRLSDGALRSFPANATAALTAWAGSSSVAVPSGYDASGNGHDFTQAASDAQPLIVENGVPILDSNGNLALKFDGVDDSLELDTTVSLSGDFLVVCAVTFDDVSGQNRILGDATSNADGIGIANATTSFLRGSSETPSQELFSSVTLTTGTVYLMVYQRTSGTLKIFINGSEQWSGAFASTINVDAVGGFSAPHDGHVEFIGVYNADKSSQRAAIEAAIAAEYGITLA